MLYWLFFEKLFRVFTPFREFGYVTFRTASASLTALFLCIALGPWLIAKLREFQIGQYIREEGPKSHMKKAGTPTMGGILIIISVAVPTLLWANLRNPYVWIALFGMLSFGLIGFWDDYAKIRRKHNRGLTVKQKLGLQMIAALIVAFVLLTMHANRSYSTSINVPFFKSFKPDLLIEAWTHNWYTYPLAFVGFYAFMVLVIVGASDSVNLTDGLDGLAIGLMIIAAGAMTILTYVTGHARLAEYLDLARQPGVSELTIFCGSTVGASIGFLWYNAHPAEIFMGDVGSLSLGGALGVVAVLIKQEILLLFIGGVYVIEALSVILQVG
ncbi:MAG TPA: phospho-N-acetylmuramoyl-pentapeptide-transferase, partial [Bryobacteraceae bacterium]|nr:phospho-N-acetylmuramoyl-pentapeptide-transferase [Bryobacteraceae bacterium]